MWRSACAHLVVVVAAVSCVVAVTATAHTASADEPLREIAAAIPACPASVDHCFGLVLHVVVTGDGPVQSAAWIAEQVAQANAHFASIGVGFELDDVRSVDASQETVVTRSQRDTLGRPVFSKGVIHCFVVGHLMNVDDDGEIYGVHWRDREERARRWVILSSVAWSRTLAHELGHFFGLEHSDYDVSIMNKTRRAAPPVEERTFAEPELATMRKRTRRMLGNGQLVAR